MVVKLTLTDHRIVFFIGRNFYVLSGNALLDSGPVPLTHIGLPDSLDKVDGAFRWGWNGKTYLFSGVNPIERKVLQNRSNRKMTLF